MNALTKSSTGDDIENQHVAVPMVHNENKTSKDKCVFVEMTVSDDTPDSEGKKRSTDSKEVQRHEDVSDEEIKDNLLAEAMKQDPLALAAVAHVLQDDQDLFLEDEKSEATITSSDLKTSKAASRASRQQGSTNDMQAGATRRTVTPRDDKGGNAETNCSNNGVKDYHRERIQGAKRRGHAHVLHRSVTADMTDVGAAASIRNVLNALEQQVLDKEMSAERTETEGTSSSSPQLPLRVPFEPEAPHVSTAFNEEGASLPGAYSVPGVGGESRWSSFTGSSLMMYPEIGQRRSRSLLSLEESDDNEEPTRAVHVTAQLVIGEEDEESRSSIVEATHVVEQEQDTDRRWLYLIMLEVVVVVVGVVVAVVLVGRSNSGNQEVTKITVVLKLDYRPFETGWSLTCGNQTLVRIPVGTYMGAERNRTVTTQHEAPTRRGCQLIVEDEGGNGIDNGQVEVYHGVDIRNESALIEREDGNFSSIKILSFVILDPPPSVPTSAPATSVSKNVDGVELITVYIKFDRYPVETGWALVCDDVMLASTSPFTYTEPNGFTRQTFAIQPGADCIFNISDTFNDGICCNLGEGFYNILNSQDVLLGAGGNFGRGERVRFFVSQIPW